VTLAYYGDRIWLGWARLGSAGHGREWQGVTHISICYNILYNSAYAGKTLQETYQILQQRSFRGLYLRL
jgi:hypothetical protein